MAELVGPTGAVTTVDIDPDITDRACRYLTSAGYEQAKVVLSDAEHGLAGRAPYDRIIVTVGVWDVPPAWVEQLTERGRLVVPLRMRGLSRSVSLIREGDHLVSTMAAHLLPLLCEAETGGVVSSWWYIRKPPCWRLRFHAGTAVPALVETLVASALDRLTRQKLVRRWWPSIYEPETPAFGGPAGIAAAHRLFHADSRNILEYLGSATDSPVAPAIGRREVS